MDVRQRRASATTAMKLVQESADNIQAYNQELTKKETLRKLYQRLGHGKKSAIWAVGITLCTVVLLLVFRPTFVYTQENDITLPSISVMLILLYALLAGAVSWGVLWYRLATTK